MRHSPLAPIFPCRRCTSLKARRRTGSFCASPRFLTSTPPPPIFSRLSSNADHNRIPHPPPTSSLIEAETDLAARPLPSPRYARHGTYISGSPRICALLPKAFPPSSPGWKKKLRQLPQGSLPPPYLGSSQRPAPQPPTAARGLTLHFLALGFWTRVFPQTGCLQKPTSISIPIPKAFQAPSSSQPAPADSRTADDRQPFPIHERGRRSAIDLLPGNPSLRSRPPTFLTHLVSGRTRALDRPQQHQHQQQHLPSCPP